MGIKQNPVQLVLGCLITVLIVLIGVSEYNNWNYTTAIEAVGAILFSGLLVWLYYRQSEILDNQEGLMEQQNQMLMESHRPQLKFEVSGFEPDDDLVSFDIENVGPGTAYDIGLEIEFDPRRKEYDTLVSYGQVVSVKGNKPTSLGVLRSSEKKEMNFEIRFPNPESNAEQQSLPVSEALSEFDYSPFSQATIFVKARYSDASGENRGGAVIEQIAFDITEPMDVEELWNYGVKYSGVEDAWIDQE